MVRQSEVRRPGQSGHRTLASAEASPSLRGHYRIEWLDFESFLGTLEGHLLLSEG